MGTIAGEGSDARVRGRFGPGVRDQDFRLVEIGSSVVIAKGEVIRKETKTDRVRRVAIDDTAAALHERHRTACRELAAPFGLGLERSSYVLSCAPEGSRLWRRDSASQRFAPDGFGPGRFGASRPGRRSSPRSVYPRFLPRVGREIRMSRLAQSSRMGAVSRRVASVLMAAALVGGVGCSERSEDLIADDTAALQAPAFVNHWVKSGQLFAALNPAWFESGQGTPVIATSDLQQWRALEGLPEQFSDIGLSVAGTRLVVATAECKTSSGEDLCQAESADNEGFDAPLSVWVLSDDGDRFDRVELPRDVLVRLGSLQGSTLGESAMLATSAGSLLISVDGTAQLIGSEYSKFLQQPNTFAESIVGSRIPWISYSQAVPAEPNEMKYVWTQVGFLDAQDPNRSPRVIELPERAPGSYPFFTANEVVWIEEEYEVSLNLESGEMAKRELPEAVRPLVAILNPRGGREGVVDRDGSIFIIPDPAYAPVGFAGGVAKRDPNGIWGVASRESLTGTAGGANAARASDGLYILADGKIRKVAQ